MANTPLRSLRISDELWESLTSYALAHNMKTGEAAAAAIQQLVTAAPGAQPVAKPALPVAHPPQSQSPAASEVRRSILDSVPVLGSFVRGPMQKREPKPLAGVVRGSKLPR